MKDQIGQYLALESDAPRWPGPHGEQAFREHIYAFFSSQNPHDLLSYLLSLIVFTSSTAPTAATAEQDAYQQARQGELFSRVAVHLDGQNHNRCTIQTSPLVERYYSGMRDPRQQAVVFNSGYLEAIEEDVRGGARVRECTPRKMDSVMQGRAIGYFV